MTRWSLLFVLILPIAWLVRRYRCWQVRRELARLEALIRPPKPVATGFDEGLRERSALRRRAAEGIRSRAAKVASGSSVAELKIVRKA